MAFFDRDTLLKDKLKRRLFNHKWFIGLNMGYKNPNLRHLKHRYMKRYVQRPPISDRYPCESWRDSVAQNWMAVQLVTAWFNKFVMRYFCVALVRS